MTAKRLHTAQSMTRRDMLKASAGAGLALTSTALAAPAIAKSRSIKIGAYGGYFEDSFKSYVYPAFTAATGIEVESITQPNSTGWMQTLQQAQTAGNVPADLSMFTPITIIKASRIGGLLAPLHSKRIGNLSNLDDYFLSVDDSGLVAVGAMGFFYSMVVNTEAVETPDSWAAFWDVSKFEASLGLPKEYNWFFLDIVAATFFDGPDTFKSRDGITALIEKAAEIHPNVALWYTAESQMEQALKNFDVVGGMYFHDVAGLMAAEGHPIASVFPTEGNPISHNSWCLAQLSEKAEEAHEFINFSCAPSTQAIMSRKIGTAPLVEASTTGLSAEELAAVAGTPEIRPAYHAYLDNETFIKESWDKMVAAA